MTDKTAPQAEQQAPPTDQVATQQADQPTQHPTVYTAEPINQAVMPGFTTQGSWELAQRIGKAFASSTLVPEAYRNNVANCIVALEMANRMGASPMMVMQNLYIVHGSPGWSSKFLVATFNQCGRFSSLRYQWNEARTECRAWAIEKATGERIEGPLVSMKIAEAEGWSTKKGSKWQTMPELMLMYRAAAFLIRTYAPEISMGLQTADEVEDITPAPQAVQVASIRLTESQMAQAIAEIDANVVTADMILARYPTLIKEQADTLTARQSSVAA